MLIQKHFLFSLFILSSIQSFGQIKQDSINKTQSNEKPYSKEYDLQQIEVPVYKLFPTDNYWVFLKLDTRNGKLWQVHFTVDKDGYQGEIELNKYSLVYDDKEINGRFTLHPSNNMYNFILIDQLNGRTYQVQWNKDEEYRFVNRIY